MVSLIHPFMNVESCRSYIDKLYSTDTQKCHEAIICLKNSVIGSNRQKGSVISQGVVTRLMQLLGDTNLPVELRTEAAVTLGSLAKGTEAHVKQLIDVGIVPLLLNSILTSEDTKLTEACLRCVCSIFRHPSAPVELIFHDTQLVTHLLSLVMHSITNQICVPTILGTATKTVDHQRVLCEQGAVYTLAALLCSPHYPVLMPTLHCLANLCYQNPRVATSVSTASFGGKAVPEVVVGLMSRDHPTEMQLAAARCLTYLHRAGSIAADDPKILYKTLPCLVVLCKKDRPCEERIVAAETLAYLTEVDTELQRLASISNHLVPTLADLLHYQPETNNNNNNNNNSTNTALQDIQTVQDMKQAAFRDHSVWKPLMQLLQGATDDILSVASSTLCNLLLDFSPSKEPILESGAVDLLCNLTRRPDPALRLNGIWALMNMAFQAEQKIKSQILNTLGTDQIFRLLSDPQVDVLMKTLGLLRNLLSTKPHIDHIMGLHGNQIMQAVILILEGNHSAEVKEQALCILANIGDGDSAKDYIMANEDVLKKLQDYMMHSNVKLQIAAIFCISNLVWKEESGSAERQAKLKEIGVYRLLQQLIMTNDTLLFDKVKTAMDQFSEA
ncbi:armadillo repeat-containing protein 8-like isoform X3 [Lycorma delicatula]|uniref:armadillo repeat-containing protein 8-like isoform X3 n=1 Tax=Lycorma delicatula TaxID=130591 RepID=UPI003F50F6D1